MGPSAMGADLAGVGLLMAPGPVPALIPPIVLIGAGIGAAWAFVLQRVMSGAKEGEENIAAAASAMVQQAGIALGAAIAGLVANASGLDNGLDPGSVLRASLWVPLALVAAPLAACAIGLRLNLMVPRAPERGLAVAATAVWRAGYDPSNSDHRGARFETPKAHCKTVILKFRLKRPSRPLIGIDALNNIRRIGGHGTG
jgi:hypothetical protein